jgi:hypothetical protein
MKIQKTNDNQTIEALKESKLKYDDDKDLPKNNSSDHASENPKKSRKREMKAHKKQSHAAQVDRNEHEMNEVRDEFWRQVEEMRPKILTYAEYVKHITGECYQFRPYKCNIACNQSEMNIHEFKYHLEHECQEMTFKCQTCDVSCLRKEILKKHDMSECLENLKKEYERLKPVKETNENLKK